MKKISGLIALLILNLATVAQACEDWVATVVAIDGEAAAYRDNRFLSLQVDQRLCPGDSVTVPTDARLSLFLRNHTFIRVNANSQLSFPANNRPPSAWITIESGITHFISRIKRRFYFNTPHVNAAVDGTEFVVEVTRPESLISVVEGIVKARVSSQEDWLSAGANDQIIANGSQLTLRPVKIQGLAEWAIFFPTNLMQELVRSDPTLAARELIMQSIDALATGQYSAAIELLTGSASSAALSLLSLAHTLIGDTNKGLEYSQRAIRNAPAGTLPHLAESYALQGQGKLYAAIDAINGLTDIWNNPFGLLRRSELMLAQGDYVAARAAIEQANVLQPDSVAIRVQQAYVLLFANDTDAALAIFDDLKVDHPEDPDIRLGRGLALINSGDPERGQRELEFAVSLDPARAVLRTYVGKSYFNDHRIKLASTQWQLAQVLDPEDPTPLFYRGIAALSLNRPITSLTYFEQALANNDNRKLYRSEQLLRSDSANRSATMATAFAELKFSHANLDLAYKTQNAAPLRPEGNRLLARWYSNSGLYDTAQDSATLQAQLLESLTSYPIQPETGAGATSFIDSQDAIHPGLNEFSSLFASDGLYGAAAAEIGADNMWSDQLVGTLLAGPLSISISQQQFDADGWRPNTDQKQSIHSFLARLQPYPNTLFQYHYNRLDWLRGDLTPRLLDSLISDERIDTERALHQFGVTQALTPQSRLLLSISSIDNKRKSFSSSDPNFDNSDSNTDSLDLAFIQQLARGSWRTGIGSYTKHRDSDIYILTPLVSTIRSQADNRYRYLHAFSHWGLPLATRWQADVAIAATRAEQDTRSISSFAYLLPPLSLIPLTPDTQSNVSQQTFWEPKLAVTFTPDQQTRVSVAAFKDFYRGSDLHYSLAPTHFGYTPTLVERAANTYSRTLSFSSEYAPRPNLNLGFEFQRARDYLYEDIADSYHLAIERRLTRLSAEALLGSNTALAISGIWSKNRADETGGTELQFDEISLIQLPIVITHQITPATLLKIEQIHLHQRLHPMNDAGVDDARSWITNVSASYRFHQPYFARLGFGVSNILDETEEFSGLTSGLTEGLLHHYPKRTFFINANINL